MDAETVSEKLQEMTTLSMDLVNSYQQWVNKETTKKEFDQKKKEINARLKRIKNEIPDYKKLVSKGNNLLNKMLRF